MIKKLRKEKGYSLSGAAKILGVPTSTYCQYESGKRSIPAPTAEKIAALLGQPIEALFSPESFTVREDYTTKNSGVIELSELIYIEEFQEIIKGLLYFTLPIQDISKVSIVDIEREEYAKAAWEAIGLFKKLINKQR